MDKSNTKTGRYWDAVTQAQPTKFLKWGHISQIKRDLSQRICGVPHVNQIAAEVSMLQLSVAGGCFDRAISVGCGEANKEIWMLEKGIVKHFDLFDLSAVRVKNCETALYDRGLSQRATVRNMSPFENDNVLSGYDLVFWNESLHHMDDMEGVIEWSKAVLIDDGVFFFREYIGPDRIQFSDQHLALANAIRQTLDDKYFIHPETKQQAIQKVIKNIPKDKLIEADPSEAVESSNIIPTFVRYFPKHEIKYLGGIVWFLALKNVYQNFESEEGHCAMEALLNIDREFAKLGINFHATGFGIK